MASPLVKDVMTKMPIELSTESKVGEARVLMARHKIRHLPVTRGFDLVGIVSQHDIKLLVAHEGEAADAMLVTEVATPEPKTIGSDAPLYEAAQIMADNRIGSLLVTKKDVTVGIVTAGDALRGMAQTLKKLSTD